MKIEDLGYDKTRLAVSSQPVIKYGPNRGRRHIEKDGEWIHISGHSYDAVQQERAINFKWAEKLINLGFRIGKLDYEGCASFFILR